MNGEATRFKIGNSAAEKWTQEEVYNTFLQMLENAENDKSILCLQDAIRSVGLYGSSVNYLVGKFPVFENIKKDVQDVIICRINKFALNGDFNATASIWRFKQLGEKDKSEIDVTNKDIVVDLPDEIE